MSVTGFSDENNATFIGNQSFERFDFNQTDQPPDYSTIIAIYDVFLYVAVVLGIPGNILSAIVWLRRHIASKNSSSIYLAALAINDFTFLLVSFITYTLTTCLSYYHWLCECVIYLRRSPGVLEPLLVLGFSVERLIAIYCPLQVCCIYVFTL